MDLKENSGKVRLSRSHYGDMEEQFGDLRLPDTVGPYPVAVVIHGGFWKEGIGLDIMDRVADDLTKHGIATWNIEYRKVGQEGGGWPGTLTDVAEAIDYLPTLAKENNIDLNQVVTIGHSAGGHLALWLAARHHLPPDSVLNTSDDPLMIKGAISLAGVSNLALMQEVHQINEKHQGLTNNPVQDFIGGSPEKVPDRYTQASPIQMLPLGIPQVLVHGALDIHVPVGISYSYKYVADSMGENVKLVEIPSAEHFKLIDPDSEAWPVIVKETTNLLNG